MPLDAGTRLGPYEIVSLIGAGGMGEVYRARDTRLQRDVALKVILDAFSHDADLVARFEQEARAAAAISHPNIIATYDVGTDAGRPFIVSELLTGWTLREELDRRRVPLRTAFEYALQMSRGIAAAHRHGIIHRDLKPANVFITSAGLLKILDFGIAKLMPTQATADMATVIVGRAAPTAQGVIVGTPGYIAPEVLQGGAADQRSDVFSLGTIFYELFAGRPAFDGSSVITILNNVLTADPPPIDLQDETAVVAGVERVIRRCVEKNPEERFQSAQDVALAFEALSVLPERSAPPVAAASNVRSRRIRYAIAAAAVIALTPLVWRGAASLIGPAAGAATYTRLTFRRGTIESARFAPDGRTVVFTASWDGSEPQLFSTLLGAQESRALGIARTDVLSVADNGDVLALSKAGPLLGWTNADRTGTLIRASLAGAAARELLPDVRLADASADGATLAVVRAVNGRSRVEFPAGTTVHETGERIDALRISHDGLRVAFGQRPPGGGSHWTVHVIERRGGQHAFDVPLDGDTLDLVWAPRGDELWMDSWVGPTTHDLYGLGLDGRIRVLARPPVDLRLMDAASNGSALAVRADRRGGIGAQFPGEQQERDLSWFDGSELDDVSADGTTLLFTEWGDGGGRNSATRTSAYLRSLDASTAVRLGDGQGFALSADGRSALILRGGSPPTLVVTPTGAGEARAIGNASIVDYRWASWMPDGAHIAFAGSERDHGVRFYLQDLKGGAPKAVTPEGVLAQTGHHPISPDGRWLAVRAADGKLMMYSLAGEPARVAASADSRLNAIGWTADSRTLFAYREDLPAPIYRIDIASGRSELVRQLAPADAAGLVGLYAVHLIKGVSGVMYSYLRDEMSDLFLVDGLR